MISKLHFVLIITGISFSIGIVYPGKSFAISISAVERCYRKISLRFSATINAVLVRAIASCAAVLGLDITATVDDELTIYKVWFT